MVLSPPRLLGSFDFYDMIFMGESVALIHNGCVDKHTSVNRGRSSVAAVYVPKEPEQRLGRPIVDRTFLRATEKV